MAQHAKGDRTAEFIATINSKREKPQWINQQQRRNQPVNNKASFVDPQYREFMKISKECSHKIRNSIEKLEQLTLLARERTVFDDGKLNRLIAEIREDIGESKRQLDYLQTKKQGHTILNTLQQRLANVTSSFKSTLEMRSRSVQQQSARQDIFGSPIPSDRSSEPPASAHLVNGHQPYDPDQTMQVVQRFPQQQQQQMILMNDQIDMSERADVMHNIESTIVELGTVFNQLATMVQAQGETITRIDMNISETAGHVEGAHEALLSYFASINSNRWLILKVFAVLFGFFVVSVIFSG